MTAVAAATRPSRLGLAVRAIDSGWELAPADAAGSAATTTRPMSPTSGWIPASVPGTVAGAYRDAGLPIPTDLDERDWWFRTSFDAPRAEAGEQLVLRIGGIATVADVLLDGEVVATTDSMFAPLEIDVTGSSGGTHELAIRCRALAPLLAEQRRPRARWRTALVTDGNLRWFRTSLLGRAPGFSPGPAIVGPWRPIMLERRAGLVVERLRLRTRLDGDTGVLTVRAVIRPIDDGRLDRARIELDGPSGSHAVDLAIQPGAGHAGTATGELRIPGVARWWPHTHGTPALHSARLVVETADASLMVDAGRVGFRSLTPGSRPDHDIERDGLDLHINGVRVFARGAVWTPVDPVGIAAAPQELRAQLQLVRDAGMNMLRIAGTGTYESPAFHDLCDEMGILVWQDLMFANLDYPFVDDAFRATAEREASDVVDALLGRPSMAVVCGNSEVEQQVAMLGLDPALGRDRFYAETLPGLVHEAGSDAITVPSAPFGGDLPFRPDRGVANYYGVGGYRRPLADARLANVRFAAECLAFSNVPDDPVAVLDDPAWKAGIPRDRGADWDFEDVRDHYLGLLYGVDPAALRRDDPGRYLALSRAVTGEVMAEVFGEWRRAASPCGGGVVLWWRDVVPGAGWGLIDRAGRPKAAYHYLRHAMAPTAIWMTDEGLGGIAVHVANDGPDQLVARLRIALYRDRTVLVGEAEERLDVAAHDVVARDVETVIGHFVDASFAYRFGPPAQDLIVATLEAVDGDPARPLAQSILFPTGRSADAVSAEALGLTALVVDGGGTDRVTVEIEATTLVRGIRLEADGFLPEAEAFAVEPGHARRVDLVRAVPGTPFRGVRLAAVNLEAPLDIERAHR